MKKRLIAIVLLFGFFAVQSWAINSECSKRTAEEEKIEYARIGKELQLGANGVYTLESVLAKMSELQMSTAGFAVYGAALAAMYAPRFPGVPVGHENVANQGFRCLILQLEDMENTPLTLLQRTGDELSALWLRIHSHDKLPAFKPLMRFFSESIRNFEFDHHNDVHLDEISRILEKNGLADNTRMAHRQEWCEWEDDDEESYGCCDLLWSLGKNLCCNGTPKVD